MSKLLLASNNPGKLREMHALLQGLPVEIVTPAGLGIDMDVQETGNTYAENATRKALVFARESGLVSLGDDSGLEVEALGGAPGVFSRRFSPNPDATDADRRKHLLEHMQGHPRPWRAKFHCTVALATPQGDVHTFEGECPGEIISEERGQNGFGYDPIFLFPESGRTMAELNMEEKNKVSHRANAVRAAIPVLLTLL
jgi:XTP/dITP diphosphohydrolase